MTTFALVVPALPEAARMERRPIGRCSIPFGTSPLAVGRQRGAEGTGPQ